VWSVSGFEVRRNGDDETGAEWEKGRDRAGCERGFGLLHVGRDGLNAEDWTWIDREGDARAAVARLRRTWERIMQLFCYGRK
jgi:hypothetical protein